LNKGSKRRHGILHQQQVNMKMELLSQIHRRDVFPNFNV
jgi:hypothetical protein